MTMTPPNNDEDNKQPPERVQLTEEEVEQIQRDGFPMANEFAKIFDRETNTEMNRLIQQRGVSGAVMVFMNELLHPEIVHGVLAPDTVEFAYRCILFGHFLNEIVANVEFEGKNLIAKHYEKNPTISDLENMWGEENNGN